MDSKTSPAGKVDALAAALGATPVPAGKVWGFIDLPTSIWEGSHNGTTFRYLVLPRTKHQRSQFHLWTQAPSTVYGKLVARRETKSDRLAKQVGVSIEVQTGDAEFDGNWYIDTETPQFAKAYLAAASRRETVTRLGALGFHEVRVESSAPSAGVAPQAGSVKVTGVIYEPGEIVKTNPDRIREAVPELRALCANLPATLDTPLTRADIAGRAILERAFDIIPAVLAAAAIFATQGGTRYSLVQWTDGIVPAAMVALPVSVLYLGLAWFLLRGKSASHKPLAIIFAATVIGFPIAAYFGLTYMNSHLDRSGPVVRELPVLDQSSEPGKKSMKYFATVKSWHAGHETETRVMRIDSAGFRILQKSKGGEGRLQVSTRQGHYGLEWIESVKVQAGTETPKAKVETAKSAKAPAPAPEAPPAYDVWSEWGDDPPKKAGMGIVTEMIDKLPPAQDARWVRISGSEIFAEVHGEDLRIQLHNFSMYPVGPVVAYIAAGVVLDRNADEGQPWQGCVLSDALDGMPVRDPGSKLLLNSHFTVPGAAHCGDGTCDLRLVVAVKPESGADFLEYSAAARMPINPTQMIPAAAAPLKPCG